MSQLLATIFNDTAGLVSLAFGLVYLFKGSFLRYHQQAVQRSWSAVDPAFQTLILALMRAVSGGAIAAAISVIALQYHFTKTHAGWIPPVILINGSCICLGSIYAMLLVRRHTPGKPPLALLFITLLLLITGYWLNAA